jgi:hypothetical protein
MKRPLLSYLTAATIAVTSLTPWLSAADSPALLEARTRLLEAFQGGLTDNDEQVKQLRAKVAALEYVAAAKATAAVDVAPRLVTVDFAGGSVAAMIAAIAKANGESGFNVVGEKADLAIEIPPFSIRNADPQSLAAALTGILQPRGYILAPNGRTVPGQSPVFTLRKLLLHENPMLQQQAGLRQFQSFQLAPYLGAQSVDDIIGAIRAAWELDPSQKADDLRLKFHPATGVLLVSGPHQSISVVQGILTQLRRSNEPSPKAQPSASPNAPLRP